MQGTWVQSLVGEDPTCREAAKLMHHNYWAPTSEHRAAPTDLTNAATYEAHEPESSLTSTREADTVRSACTTTREQLLLSTTKEKALEATKTQDNQK